MSDRPPDDLEDRIDELEATLEALRDELGPRRGPMGLPRPPGPRRLLRFSDEYAIPAAIAAMEANIRALELLQAGIRATDPGRTADEAGRVFRDRASDAGRASLEQLDRALSELEAAIEGSGLPANREASELLADARRLNEEIRDRVEAGEAMGRSGAVRIDVESELDSIREEVSDEETADEDVDGE